MLPMPFFLEEVMQGYAIHNKETKIQCEEHRPLFITSGEQTITTPSARTTNRNGDSSSGKLLTIELVGFLRKTNTPVGTTRKFSRTASEPIIELGIERCLVNVSQVTSK